VFPLALLLGMKARSRYWLYMTHGITLISISSIALGYYIAINPGTAGVPVQEYGWLCGLLIILAAQAYDSGTSAPFARWNSARVRLAWLVLSFNLAMLMSLYFIQIFISKDALQLTSILFIFFGLWLVANLLAFRISEDIYLLLENVHAGAAADAKPAFRIAIYEAELFAEKLLAAYETIKAQSRLAALAALSAQVAHDIRSPLAALDSALKDVSQMPEEKRLLISAATGRIRDIANDLLEKNRQDRTPAAPRGGRPPESVLLSGLIGPVITEKRLQYRDRPDVKIEAGPWREADGLCASVDPVKFGRVLSNLINNSVEALERGGSVAVALARRGGLAEITVSDYGKGIPAEVLRSLDSKGGTYGKAGGSGLGLSHARAAAEACGGSLSIASEPGKGTVVTISLPLTDGPAAIPKAAGFNV
jgi:signal transduction histidine kinase